MNTNSAFVRSASLCSLALVALVAGCAGDEAGDGGPGESVSDTNASALSYEEFKATHFFPDPGDPNALLLHGDVAVEIDSPAMWSLYEDEAAGQRIAINRINNVDDKWNATTAQNLVYCVSNDFGPNKITVANALVSAGNDWEAIANVNFVYMSIFDANCSPSNNSVVFDVHPGEVGAGVYARAFFPSTTRISRSIVIDPEAFGNIAPWTITGVLRHELGHALGFRHEHTRPEAGGVCFENNVWRALTSYDSVSVMHYPQCNGTNSGDLNLTSRDASGAAFLYP
jgi:serine protease